MTRDHAKKRGELNIVAIVIVYEHTLALQHTIATDIAVYTINGAEYYNGSISAVLGHRGY